MAQVDVFQFYAGSADAAPGKGAGETLVSAPETYAELRKMKHWRRTLAEGQDGMSEEVRAILRATGDAQLWHGGPRMKKIRLEALEALRTSLAEVAPEEVQRNATQEVAMEAKPKKPRTKKAKAGEGASASETAAAAAAQVQDVLEGMEAAASTVGMAPENVLASGSAASAGAGAPTPALAAVLPEEEDAPSTLRFCPLCRNYLFLQSSEEGDLQRICRRCQYTETDEKGGLVMELLIQEKSSEGYKILLNEFTRLDPRLPHIHGTIKCPDGACASNTGQEESDVIFMKYDAVNLMYLYICDVCGKMWHSAKR